MAQIKLRPDVEEGTHWTVWLFVLVALVVGIFLVMR